MKELLRENVLKCESTNLLSKIAQLSEQWSESASVHSLITLAYRVTSKTCELPVKEKVTIDNFLIVLNF